jgi:parallel beta-helix repeat protein
MKIAFIFFFLLALQKLDAQSSQMINVLSFGANGRDDKDDTKAIQNCIDSVAKKGGGIVYIPNGTYIVSRPSARAIVLQARSNVSLIGQSRNGTIIKLAPHQREFSWILLLTAVDSINIRNLTLDGSVNQQIDTTKPISYSNPDQHLAGMFLDNAAHVKISNCKLVNTGGDGIGIRGVLVPSNDITIDSCYFDNNYREGIVLGSGFRNITISNCYFGSAIKHDPIHTEPDKGLFFGDCLIENNNINNPHRLTIAGSHTGITATGYVVKNNRFVNASIYIMNTSNVEISGNTFNNPKENPAINIFRKNNGTLIKNNVFTGSNDAFIVTTYSANEYSKNIVIDSNKFNYDSVKSACIKLRGSDNIKIINNVFSTSKNSNTLLEVTTTRQMDSVEFSNNQAGYFQTNFSFRIVNNNLISTFIAENNNLGNKKYQPVFNISGSESLVNMIIRNNH